MLEQGYTIVKASHNLGIGKSTLDNWLKRQREMETSGLSETDREKLLRLEKDIVLNALLMAVWRRHPKQEVIVHSDQGIQYTGDDCQRFMQQHGLLSSMSRRGNCYDNAVAESFFHSLKTERIKRRIYNTRESTTRYF